LQQTIQAINDAKVDWVLNNANVWITHAEHYSPLLWLGIIKKMKLILIPITHNKAMPIERIKAAQRVYRQLRIASANALCDAKDVEEQYRGNAARTVQAMKALVDHEQVLSNDVWQPIRKVAQSFTNHPELREDWKRHIAPLLEQILTGWEKTLDFCCDEEKWQALSFEAQQEKYHIFFQHHQILRWWVPEFSNMPRVKRAIERLKQEHEKFSQDERTREQQEFLSQFVCCVTLLEEQATEPENQRSPSVFPSLFAKEKFKATIHEKEAHQKEKRSTSPPLMFTRMNTPPRFIEEAPNVHVPEPVTVRVLSTEEVISDPLCSQEFFASSTCEKKIHYRALPKKSSDQLTVAQSIVIQLDVEHWVNAISLGLLKSSSHLTRQSVNAFLEIARQMGKDDVVVLTQWRGQERLDHLNRELLLDKEVHSPSFFDRLLGNTGLSPELIELRYILSVVAWLYRSDGQLNAQRRTEFVQYLNNGQAQIITQSLREICQGLITILEQAADLNPDDSASCEI
jgi:uncharacterized protein Usg